MDQHIIDAAVDAAIERAMRRDMQWGVDDCSLWCCNTMAVAGAEDFAAPLRGYSSCFGAARALKNFAGAGLIEAALKIAASHGLAQACRPFRGNLIGVVMSPNRPSLALFWRGGWVARSQTGITYLPAAAGVIAWKWT
jgi:hypothetical protein